MFLRASVFLISPISSEGINAGVARGDAELVRNEIGSAQADHHGGEDWVRVDRGGHD